MPYPILTLPYPFAKRLRQLLHPFELEALQRAAGSYLRNELKPIVEMCHLKGVRISAKNENAYELRCVHNKIIIPKCNQLLINSTPGLCCFSLTNSTFENSTTQLLIKAYKILFFYCHISTTVLKNVSKRVYKPWQLDFLHCRLVDEDVTISTVVDIFPSVKCIRIGKAYFGWLHDLIGTEKEYRMFSVVNDDFDKLFSFKPSDLYDFIKSQPSDFCMSLTYRVNASRYDWIIHLMNKYIDPRFSNTKNDHCKVILRVQQSENMQMYKSYHYYF